MRTLLLLSLLLVFIVPGQNSTGSNQDSSVVVLSSKWSKSRQITEQPDTTSVPPATGMKPTSRNFERNVRANNTAGMNNPNEETIDERSAALEKNVQKSRVAPSKPVDGYTYRAKVKNAGTRVIEILFWEYQFKELASPTTITRRQFICAVNIKPDKEKELQSFSASGPSDVISVESLSNKSAGNLFEEKVIINRVEYADGTIWQRKDWNFSEVRLSLARAIGTPWGAEMCRGL